MAEKSGLKRLTFGICADPHKDIMHDADQRLQAFVDTAVKAHVDFIIQLGDFCRPYDYNRGFMDIWERFDGTRYHVLGNHDTDGGFTREQAMAYWGMRRRYYSFDAGGYHFVVLDGNDRMENQGAGYPRYIRQDQLEWLREDLRSTDTPTILFCHQSLESSDGLENGKDARAVLEDANETAGWKKVAACFSGHDHIDHCVHINGIHYVEINSMSNYWLGDDYIYVRYSKEIDAQYPWIKYTAPYRDALYALVTLEPEGIIRIDGVESAFVGPSPGDLGFSTKRIEASYPDESVMARISDRVLEIQRI